MKIKVREWAKIISDTMQQTAEDLQSVAAYTQEVVEITLQVLDAIQQAMPDEPLEVEAERSRSLSEQALVQEIKGTILEHRQEHPIDESSAWQEMTE